MIAGTEALTWVLQRLFTSWVVIVGLIYFGMWICPRHHVTSDEQARKTLRKMGF